MNWMSNNLPAPLGEGMLTVWVDALKAIPGAAKAIAHLVSGAADAGNAWVDVIKARGERQAQQIRDETETKSAFINSIARVATEKATQNPELVDRAITYLSATLPREQQTRRNCISGSELSPR
jgi:hypothetical protein